MSIKEEGKANNERTRKKRSDSKINVQPTLDFDTNDKLCKLSYSCGMSKTNMAFVILRDCLCHEGMVSTYLKNFGIDPGRCLVNVSAEVLEVMSHELVKSKKYRYPEGDKSTVNPALDTDTHSKLERLAFSCGMTKTYLAFLIIRDCLNHAPFVEWYLQRYNTDPKKRLAIYKSEVGLDYIFTRI